MRYLIYEDGILRNCTVLMIIRRDDSENPVNMLNVVDLDNLTTEAVADSEVESNVLL